MSRKVKNTAAEKERMDKEAAEKREAEFQELRRKVIEEQIAHDPIRQYVKDLEVAKEKVEDPLEYSMVEGTEEEWSNVPKVVAKYVIHMQSHLASSISYLKKKSTEESPMHLRSFFEKVNEEQDSAFNSFKDDANGRLDDLGDYDLKLSRYAAVIDKEFNKLKNYFEE